MDTKALKLSKYLISRANFEEGGELLSNLKLQKLLYYCQGFYYAKHNLTLFDSSIEAWQYGPVVPEIYREFKNHGSKGIPLENNPYNFKFIDNEKEMIDDVYNYFNQFSALKLMEMTHSESPWNETNINDVITLEKLNNHFKRYLK